MIIGIANQKGSAAGTCVGDILGNGKTIILG